MDKLSQAEIKKHVHKLNAAYFNGGEDILIAYSSKSSRWRKELWNKISNRMEAFRNKGVLAKN